MCLLTLVYVRPPVSLGDLDVAEAGDQEGEVCALAVWEGGENLQRLARLEDVVDRERVGDDGVPRSGRKHRLEVEVATVALAEPERLADRDDVEPAEDRCPVGLGAQQDGPRVLAGVLDELTRGVDRVGDRAVEVAVVAAVELVLVAAQRRATAQRLGCGFGRGLHEPRPG